MPSVILNSMSLTIWVAPTVFWGKCNTYNCCLKIVLNLVEIFASNA